MTHANATRPTEFEGYNKFRGDDGSEYGSFEVFHQDEPYFTNEGKQDTGWYWWACFPGCIPDGDPNGPFPTAEGAYLDALEGTNGLFPIAEDDLPNHGDWAIPATDTVIEEGTRFERAFGDGNDVGG